MEKYLKSLHKEYGINVTNKQIVNKINELVDAFNELNEEITIQNYKTKLDDLKSKNRSKHKDDIQPTDEELKLLIEEQQKIQDINIHPSTWWLQDD